MTILHTVIARGSAVLVKHSTVFGDYDSIINEVVKQNFSEKRCSYKYNEFLINFIIEKNIHYICVTEEKYNRELCFKYLEFVSNEFQIKYGNLVNTALPYAMNSEFSKFLKIYMEHYSKDVNKINNIQMDVDNLTEVMQQNIHKAIDRGERVDRMYNASEVLTTNAIEFNRASGRVRRSYWCRNIKTTLVICLGVAILLAIIIGLIVWDSKRKSL